MTALHPAAACVKQAIENPELFASTCHGWSWYRLGHKIVVGPNCRINYAQTYEAVDAIGALDSVCATQVGDTWATTVLIVTLFPNFMTAETPSHSSANPPRSEGGNSTSPLATSPRLSDAAFAGIFCAQRRGVVLARDRAQKVKRIATRLIGGLTIVTLGVLTILGMEWLVGAVTQTLRNL